jgi:hypothetical protein
MHGARVIGNQQTTALQQGGQLQQGGFAREIEALFADSLGNGGIQCLFLKVRRAEDKD